MGHHLSVQRIPPPCLHPLPLLLLLFLLLLRSTKRQATPHSLPPILSHDHSCLLPHLPRSSSLLFLSCPPLISLAPASFYHHLHPSPHRCLPPRRSLNFHVPLQRPKATQSPLMPPPLIILLDPRPQPLSRILPNLLPLRRPLRGHTKDLTRPRVPSRVLNQFRTNNSWHNRKSSSTQVFGNPFRSLTIAPSPQRLCIWDSWSHSRSNLDPCLIGHPPL